MRAANLFVGVVTILWFALCLVGRGLIRGVYLQGAGIGPNATQIDFYLVYPLIAVALLLLAGWVGNLFRKLLLIAIPSAFIGLLLLPFVSEYTGGM
jgi:hypothetical protein